MAVRYTGERRHTTVIGPFVLNVAIVSEEL